MKCQMSDFDFDHGVYVKCDQGYTTCVWRASWLKADEGPMYVCKQHAAAIKKDYDGDEQPPLLWGSDAENAFEQKNGGAS